MNCELVGESGLCPDNQQGPLLGGVTFQDGLAWCSVSHNRFQKADEYTGYLFRNSEDHLG